MIWLLQRFSLKHVKLIY